MCFLLPFVSFSALVFLFLIIYLLYRGSVLFLFYRQRFSFSLKIRRYFVSPRDTSLLWCRYFVRHRDTYVNTFMYIFLWCRFFVSPRHTYIYLLYDAGIFYVTEIHTRISFMMQVLCIFHIVRSRAILSVTLHCNAHNVVVTELVTWIPTMFLPGVHTF